MQHTITLTDHQEKALADSVPDVDIFLQQYIDNLANDKVSKLVYARSKVLRDDPAVTTMPASEDGILDEYFNNPEYKDRATLDAERLASK